MELKLSTLIRTPKINRLLKKRRYIVDIVAAVLIFLFVSLTLPLFSKVTGRGVL